MECLLQYLDDLDDLYGMAGLIAEKARTLLLAVLSLALIASGAIGGFWLATAHPPMALAISCLMFVALLVRAVVLPPQSRAPQSV